MLSSARAAAPWLAASCKAQGPTLPVSWQVRFFLRQLEQQREAPQPRPGPQVRNRRLAHLNRLIDAGAANPKPSSAAAHDKP